MFLSVGVVRFRRVVSIGCAVGAGGAGCEPPTAMAPPVIPESAAASSVCRLPLRKVPKQPLCAQSPVPLATCRSPSRTSPHPLRCAAQPLCTPCRSRSHRPARAPFCATGCAQSVKAHPMLQPRLTAAAARCRPSPASPRESRRAARCCRRLCSSLVRSPRRGCSWSGRLSNTTLCVPPHRLPPTFLTTYTNPQRCTAR